MLTEIKNCDKILLQSIRRTDVPVVVDISVNGDVVGQIKGEHSRGSPAVESPCVRRVSSVGIPQRREVCAVTVGAVLVLLKFKAAAGAALKEPPIGLVAEFGEVRHSVLHIGMLAVSAYGGGNFLVYAVAGFHIFTVLRGIFFVGGNFHLR